MFVSVRGWLNLCSVPATAGFEQGHLAVPALVIQEFHAVHTSWAYGGSWAYDGSWAYGSSWAYGGGWAYGGSWAYGSSWARLSASVRGSQRLAANALHLAYLFRKCSLKSGYGLTWIHGLWSYTFIFVGVLVYVKLHG